MLDSRAAPAVDRLVVVADDERQADRPGERLEPCVLDRVRVLEFVDENVAEPGAVVFDEARRLAPQLVAAQQKLREIDDPVAPAGFLVGLVQADHLSAGRIALVLEMLRTQSLVLLSVDEPGDLLRHPARLVELERSDDLADEPLLVLGIEDLEGLRQPGLAPVHPQQPVCDAVEGADPQRSRRQAELRLDAAAHLAGRLVGERHREDAVRRDVLDLHQPRDPMREHARLAAARAREHERRRERRGDGLALRVVERIEEVGDVHGGRDCSNPRPARTRPAIASPSAVLDAVSALPARQASLAYSM